MSHDLSRRAFLTGRPAAGDSVGVATLSRDACIAWDGAICISCKISCPEHAIVLDAKGRPTILESPCTGCGDCIPVCPTSAIS